MVAVTVVLAATAFVLVADIGGNATEPAPAIGFRLADVDDELQVTASDPAANWDRIVVSLSQNVGGGAVKVGNAVGVVNEPADANGKDLGAQTDLVSTSSPITGGDVLAFCRVGGADGLVEIKVVDAVVNQLLGTYKFETIHVCPP